MCRSTIMHVPHSCSACGSSSSSFGRSCKMKLVVVACKPIWQDMRAYRTITNNPFPHTLMLNCCWYLHSILSAITQQVKCFLTYVDMDIFLVLVYRTRAQISSAAFSCFLYLKGRSVYSCVRPQNSSRTTPLDFLLQTIPGKPRM
jgi:hypothetical protein